MNEALPCEVCGADECFGPIQHQLTILLMAYAMAHRRGDHQGHPLARCPLCEKSEIPHSEREEN